MVDVGGIGGVEFVFVLFFKNGLKGFFPSPLFLFKSKISFVSFFIILCMLSMYVESLSFFSESILEILLFFLAFLSN